MKPGGAVTGRLRGLRHAGIYEAQYLKLKLNLSRNFRFGTELSAQTGGPPYPPYPKRVARSKPKAVANIAPLRRPNFARGPDAQDQVRRLPVVEVPDSEEITVAVRPEDTAEADPERHAIAIALRRQRGVGDARVSRREVMIRRGDQWFRYGAPKRVS